MSHPQAKYLEGEKLALRPATSDDDLRFAAEVANQSRGAVPESLTPVKGIDFKEMMNGDWIMFIGYPLDEDGELESDPVGYVRLRVKPESGKATVVGAAKASARGKGYGVEGFVLATNYAFANHPIHKVFTLVFDNNEPSKKLHEAAGFQQEGRLPDHRYIDGEYVDSLHYYITRDQWTESDLHQSMRD